MKAAAGSGLRRALQPCSVVTAWSKSSGVSDSNGLTTLSSKKASKVARKRYDQCQGKMSLAGGSPDALTMQLGSTDLERTGIKNMDSKEVEDIKQHQPDVPSTTAARRGRKPKAVGVGRDSPIVQLFKVPGPTVLSSGRPPASIKVVSYNTTSVGARTPSDFQTTGAFLTRTASKLLGGHAVTGVDCNIHGYAYGRAVKVQNVDGTWYFGSMVNLENGKIKIHFDGWGSEWDEWIASDSKRLRILNVDEIQHKESVLQAMNSDTYSSISLNESNLERASPLAASSETGIQHDGAQGQRRTGKPVKRRTMQMDQEDNIVNPVARIVNVAKRQKKPAKPTVGIPPYQNFTNEAASGSRRTQVPILGPGSTDRDGGGCSEKLTTQPTTEPHSVQEQQMSTAADVRSTLSTILIEAQIHPLDKSQMRHDSTIQKTDSDHVFIQYDGQARNCQGRADVSNGYPKLSGFKPIHITNADHPTLKMLSSVATKSELKHSIYPTAEQLHLPFASSTSTSSELATSTSTFSLGHGPALPDQPLAPSSDILHELSICSDNNEDLACTLAPLHDRNYRDLNMRNPKHGYWSDRGDCDARDGAGNGRIGTKDITPAASSFPSFGNPIPLVLAPSIIFEFKHLDEKKEIISIIQQVLGTGLITNRAVETPRTNLIQSGIAIRRKNAALSVNGNGNSQEERSSSQGDGAGNGGESDCDNVPQRTFTKTRDRFVALLETRHDGRGLRSLEMRNATESSVKKNESALQEVLHMATRNMSDTPSIRFTRQIAYDYTTGSVPSFGSFERRRQETVKALSTRREANQQPRGAPGTSSAFIGGVTFNEAGQVETSPSLKITSVKGKHHKINKKCKGQRMLKTMKDLDSIHDDDIMGANGVFQSLRSLTRSKKRKRILEDGHIAFLRQAMVPGARIQARDRQMDWLTATIRDIKNSRVLVHYEGYQDFFNEWIDINSERLRFDSSLVQETLVQANNEPADNSNLTLDASTTLLQDSSLLESDITTLADSVPLEEAAMDVHCIQCQVKISQFRIYFGPRGVRPVKGGIITRFEKDPLDTAYKESESLEAVSRRAVMFDAMMDLENDQGFVYLEQWKSRRVCAFCNDDGTSKDRFIGPYPFILASTNRYGHEKKRHFWAHDACARHSPEVIQGKDGTWYNVTVAMRRGRTVEKGATIGCFDPKCGRSFHVPCTNKPMSHFEDGVIFWCPQHERALLQRDAYNETFSCDKCSKILGVDAWQTCIKCSDDFFQTFDLCQECFSHDRIDHEHDRQDFKKTSLELMYKEQLLREAAQTSEQGISTPLKRKHLGYKPKPRSLSRVVCSYCWSAASTRWRKAGPINEVPMQPDLGAAHISESFELNQLPSKLAESPEDADWGVGKYATSAEDYSHSPYLTRTAVSADRFDHSSSQAVYLDSYGPAEHQLYSLPIDTTYYDIPGRAPRWATHSGTDYHGTWLPQTVRRAVTKYTNPNDKILSNFLGRGTDAIECFLLGRCCTAVDINPAAITLSIRNCSFAIPPGGNFKAEHRPTILQADSRKLSGPLFESESFDHVLSHPPYKDCVAYSTHIDDAKVRTAHSSIHSVYASGDLSRFGNAEEFQREMSSVIRETYRLLKMGRRCTLGIGDNREHCFYIPVSFQLIRQYINKGFELEELIVKRQRYCAMFGLGTYLCVQFDFLCFTHEFIATLRKIPKDEIDTMILYPDFTLLQHVAIKSTKRAIPSCPIERKSVVMGSVWTFKPTDEYDFPTLCVSRMVERFGRNGANWEEFKLDFKVEETKETQDQQWAEYAADILPPEEEEMVSYERDRLQQIQENNRMLLALGLITDLSETSDDIAHQEKISKDSPCYPPPAITALRMVAHIPGARLKAHHIPVYRTAIMHLAMEALEKLPVTGVFIVGTQDMRAENGKLMPLSMLILEDVIRVVGDDCLKLKELGVLPRIYEGQR
ncbi:hypothetical protein BGZ54_002733 [Gamsiella multidivaricata]|nr:hypothetical protein BGZ54_002733 [Gamsiella multidivaricata]